MIFPLNGGYIIVSDVAGGSPEGYSYHSSDKRNIQSRAISRKKMFANPTTMGVNIVEWSADPAMA